MEWSLQILHLCSLDQKRADRKILLISSCADSLSRDGSFNETSLKCQAQANYQAPLQCSRKQLFTPARKERGDGFEQRIWCLSTCRRRKPAAELLGHIEIFLCNVTWARIARMINHNWTMSRRQVGTYGLMVPEDTQRNPLMTADARV